MLIPADKPLYCLLIDNFIDADNEDDRLSWMECLTAAIEAGDQQSASSNFERDRKSIRRRITRRVSKYFNIIMMVIKITISNDNDKNLYQ